MPHIRPFTHLSLIIVTMSLFSCSGQRPDNLGIIDNRLAACPASPNCVSSDAGDDTHRALPFTFNGSADDAWQAAKSSVLALPRTRIITETADYLHAECQSAVFGFVDDLELHLRRDASLIAFRSASRLGHSDFGVNRARIETLRASLIKRGIIR